MLGMSANEFLESPVNYKPDKRIETPYMKASLEWDDRLGSGVRQARNWRLVAVVVSGVSLVLSCGLVILSFKSKYLPVIVEVDGSGRVDTKGVVSSFTASEREIKFFLVEFIKKVRGVSKDPVLIKKNWLEAYKFLKSEAANNLNEIAQREASLSQIGKISVSVEPISVVRIGDSENYQVRWKETVYEDSGVKISDNVMNGVFSVVIESPGDDEVFVNPLGVFIRNFQWSREIG